MLNRFYLPSISIKGKDITIFEKNVIHQITKVLRLKINDVFIIFSSQAEYQIIIKNITDEAIIATIIKITRENLKFNCLF